MPYADLEAAVPQSKFTWRPAEGVHRALDVLGQRLGQVAGELLEGGREVGVVLVRVPDHEPGREEDRHRFLERELERRQFSCGRNADEVIGHDAARALSPVALAFVAELRAAGAVSYGIVGPGRRH